MPEQLWVDTNVIIRFLVKDQEDQFEEALNLMRLTDRGEIELIVHPIVIAECCDVLGGAYYKFPREKISQWLQDFLESEGIKSKSKELMIIALEIFGAHNVDFEDAYLAALTVYDSPKKVVTFDRGDFKKLKVEFYRPREIVSSLEK